MTPISRLRTNWTFSEGIFRLSVTAAINPALPPPKTATV